MLTSFQGNLVGFEVEDRDVREEHLETAFHRAARHLSDDAERKEFLALKDVRSLQRYIVSAII